MTATATTRAATADAARAPHSDFSKPAAPTLRPFVGAWRLGKLLGNGPATEVRAAQPANCPADHPFDYAVKQPRPGRDEELALQLLRREALAAAQVAHPNLVTLIASQVHAEPYHLVIPLLPGVTLGQVVGSGLRIPTPHALWLARQVAEALAALHAHGWLHGDVKPDNIVASTQGHATLIDLGFAARLDSLLVGPPDAFRGSPRYAAPERWSTKHRVAAASDLYSLGVTLFELLAGQPPFAGDEVEAVLEAHRQTAPPDARDFAPTLSGRVVWLLNQLLAKDSLRRPRSAEDVARLLKELEIESFADR